MTDPRRRNALIGLFVLGSLVCLGIMIVKFGETQSWFGKRYQLAAKFDRIVGAREGTEVRLAGVWIGNVKKVDLANRDRPEEGVYVEMEISKDFSVPQGSVANVVMPLMGQPIINIIPLPVPQPPLPRDGKGMITGKIVNPLEQVLDQRMIATVEATTEQIRVLAHSLTPVADDLHELLRKRSVEQVDVAATRPAAEQVTANLYTAVERMDNVLRHVETVLGDPSVQSNLKETVANLRTASEDARLAVADFRQFGQGIQQTNADARKVLTHLDETIDTTHQHIDTLGKKLVQNSDQLARTLDYFSSAGRDLAEGQGTLGLFLRDPKFYEELFLTVQRLAAAAQDLQVTVKQWRDAGFPVKLK